MVNLHSWYFPEFEIGREGSDNMSSSYSKNCKIRCFNILFDTVQNALVACWTGVLLRKLNGNRCINVYYRLSFILQNRKLSNITWPLTVCNIAQILIWVNQVKICWKNVYDFAVRCNHVTIARNGWCIFKTVLPFGSTKV